MSGGTTPRGMLECFTALVQRHGPMVLRVCRSVLSDPNDADDAFQATFPVLVRRAGSLWVHEALGPWLHQVAHRTAVCARSAAARRWRHEEAASVRSSRFTDAHVEAHDLAEVLHGEVSRLPDRYRVVIVLCLLEGLTHAQAAGRLGWPAGTVQSRLARGKALLRDRLTRRELALPPRRLVHWPRTTRRPPPSRLLWSMPQSARSPSSQLSVEIRGAAVRSRAARRFGPFHQSRRDTP